MAVAVAQKLRTATRPRTPESSRRTPIIDIHHLHKVFRVGKSDIEVLKDISLSIYPQEFVIILGPSGSGKSTLLNTILGLEPTTSGKVLVNGDDLTKLHQNELAQFRFRTYGIVFQRADWIRSLNVLQNVSLPLALANASTKERLAKSLERLKQMGLEDHAQYYPAELSGGQQQKLSLARALINDPPIMVADEPTGNLDTISAKKVMDFFKDLNERLHKTILMVTHNIEYVNYGSRIINVRDGNITEGM